MSPSAMRLVGESYRGGRGRKHTRFLFKDETLFIPCDGRLSIAAGIAICVGDNIVDSASSDMAYGKLSSGRSVSGISRESEGLRCMNSIGKRLPTLFNEFAQCPADPYNRNANALPIRQIPTTTYSRMIIGKEPRILVIDIYYIWSSNRVSHINYLAPVVRFTLWDSIMINQSS
jgi:hypothetical protein